ncbi:hypothetical protein ACIBCD_06015 [Nocardia brasiliensis]|uniref:hypothetical protein n=1 Tax=Nocardia brasiliensis TaxID=37326 RepID=UPI003796E1EF
MSALTRPMVEQVPILAPGSGREAEPRSAEAEFEAATAAVLPPGASVMAQLFCPSRKFAVNDA